MGYEAIHSQKQTLVSSSHSSHFLPKRKISNIAKLPTVKKKDNIQPLSFLFEGKTIIFLSVLIGDY